MQKRWNGYDAIQLNHHMDNNNPESLVEECERLFVCGRNHEALVVANRVLLKYKSELTSNIQQETVDKDLYKAIFPRTLSSASKADSTGIFAADVELLVDIFSNDVTLADRSAAVALQCSHEIIRERGARVLASLSEIWDIIGAFLLYYSEEPKRPMPLPVVVLWIQFCFNTMEDDNARFASVELSARILHISTSRDPVSGDRSNACTLDESYWDELVWILLTTMLPWMSPQYVQSIMTRIRSNSWESLSSDGPMDSPISDCISKESVSEILMELDDATFSAESTSACRDELERILSELCDEESMNDDDFALSSSRNERDIVRRPAVETTLTTMRQRILEWQEEWRKKTVPKLVSFLRDRVVHPLLEGDRRWENRGRAVLAIWVMWIAWKRRRRISGAASASVSMLLSPLKEVLDALIPSNQ